jgi:hypothetical protein
VLGYFENPNSFSREMGASQASQEIMVDKSKKGSGIAYLGFVAAYVRAL